MLNITRISKHELSGTFQDDGFIVYFYAQTKDHPLFSNREHIEQMKDAEYVYTYSKAIDEILKVGDYYHISCSYNYNFNSHNIDSVCKRTITKDVIDKFKG